MAELSATEREQVAAGASAFVRELQKTAPGMLEDAAASGVSAGAGAAFLGQYTETIGELATTSFSDALQSLLEEEGDAEAGVLQSADGGASIGFFILRAFRKRLCNPAAEADLKAEIDRIRNEHKLDMNPTAAGISGGAATAVALSVGTLIGGGTLAVVLAPLAGSIALLLLLVGVDAFCDWAASRDA
jgi:hypothetical protein